MRMILSLIVATALLSGCCNTKYMVDVRQFQIPDHTMQMCDDIEHLKSAKDTDVVDFTKGTLSKYSECKQLNADKADALTKIQKVIKSAGAK